MNPEENPGKQFFVLPPILKAPGHQVTAPLFTVLEGPRLLAHQAPTEEGGEVQQPTV